MRGTDKQIPPSNFSSGENREAFKALIRALQSGKCSPQELTSYILSQQDSAVDSEEESLRQADEPAAVYHLSQKRTTTFSGSPKTKGVFVFGLTMSRNGSIQEQDRSFNKILFLFGLLVLIFLLRILIVHWMG